MHATAAVVRLRGQILASLGLAAPLSLGCGASGPSGDPMLGPVGNITSTTASSGSGSESVTGEPRRGGCALLEVEIDADALAEYPGCDLPLATGSCPNVFHLACTESTGEGCDVQCPTGVCEECIDNVIVAEAIGTCGAYIVNGRCCSLVASEDAASNNCGGGFIEGRPFFVDGVARVAGLVQQAFVGDTRCTGGPSTIEALSPSVRRALAEHWARVARAEHASIASFARFCIDLLAVGAPPELVADAFSAARDEVEHAEAALALAARYGGARMRFTALDVRGAIDDERGCSLEHLVLAAVHEGCVGETLAALRLAEASRRCADPEVAALLRSISDDEARHASLAWRFVQWALRRDASLGSKIAASFARLEPHEATPGHSSNAEHEVLVAHGCLVGAARLEVERAGFDALLRPCVDALLSDEPRPA